MRNELSEKDANQHGDPYGNIWITSRTRMQSHSRYVRYDLISHIVLTAYSVLLLGFSVFSSHLDSTNIGPYLSEISTVLSLSVLCASLVIWGLKFGKTADEHRECYLALQRLYDDKEARQEISAYHEILDRYPNQSNFDYESMLYRNVWCQKKVLQDRTATISFGCVKFLKFQFSRFIRVLLGIFVLTFPLIFIVILYVAG